MTVDRESRTLVKAMDALVTGEIAAAGDMVMRPFFVVETSLNAVLNMAQHMKLIPVNAVSSASHFDQRAAPRMTAREMRVHVLLSKVAGWGCGQGRSHVSRESPVRPFT